MIILLILPFLLADVLFRLVPASWTTAAIIIWCAATFAQPAKEVRS